MNEHEQPQKSLNENHNASAHGDHDKKGPPLLAVSVKTFCKITSLGRSTCFDLMREGSLETRLINRRRLILMRSIEALLLLKSQEGASNA